MMTAGRSNRRVLLVGLQALVLLVLVFPFVHDCFRDNDQASIISGAWQIARGETPFWHATFYNFDKQWGAFLALWALYRVFPGADAVLAPNVMLTVLVATAWITLAFRTGRTQNVPLPLLLPVILSPALVLYMPFFGTGWLSLAFLLLAFSCLGAVGSRASQIAGLILLTAAAACRGDVVLAVPALVLSLMSRAGGVSVLKRPLIWLAAIAAIAPVLAGKWMAGVRIPDANPMTFDIRPYIGFLGFGLSPSVLVLLACIVVVYLAIAVRKRRFFLFYAGLACSPLVPFGFYSLQMYTLRYWFLTIASVLFVVSSRRSVWLYRAAWRARQLPMKRAVVALVTLTVLPWFVGLKIPTVSHARLTITDPTRFPTGDGRFPMGAYLGFQRQVLVDDHMAIDHNEKIWLSARSMKYDACEGRIPFLQTPMSNFIEFAIRMQKLTPQPLDTMPEAKCGFAYVDARSILRGNRPNDRDGPMFSQAMRLISPLNNGEVIVRADARQKATNETEALEGLRRVLGPRNAEIFFPAARIPVKPGLKYAVFSDQPCIVSSLSSGVPAEGLRNIPGMIRATWTGKDNFPVTVDFHCPSAWSGWARTSLPAFMGM